jgi:hypothetical protein
MFPTDELPVHEVVKCIADTVHMDPLHLPPDEHLGGEDALILDGNWTFKVFRGTGPFSERMECDVPSTGERIKLRLPIQTHAHGDGSTGAAAYRIGVDGVFGRWYTTFIDFMDRTWFTLEEEFVSSGSTAHITLDLESRAIGGIDFWLDKLEYDEVSIVEEPTYARTFWLLPTRDKITLAEFSWLMTQLAEVIYTGQYTFGFSANDAGIGAHLTSRTVNAVSLHPGDWDEEALMQFFDTLYPGVVLNFIHFEVSKHFPVGTDDYPPESWYVPTSQLFTATHRGIDINLDVSPYGDVERGFPVYAVLDGTVHYVTNDWSGVGMCVIRHTLNNVPYWVMYAHIDLIGLAVDGQVLAGQMLGRIANWTQPDGGDHLHFGVSISPVQYEYSTHTGWVDPVPWLKSFLTPTIVDLMLLKGSPTTPPVPTPVEPQVVLRSNNVLGLHSQREKEGWDSYLLNSGTNVMKTFDIGFAMNAARIAPDATIVWRQHSDDIAVSDGPQRLLDRYSSIIDEYCTKNGVPLADVLNARLVLESLNEQIGTFVPDQIKKAVNFDVMFAELLHGRYGKTLRPGLLTVAVGNPHESEFELLLPAAKAAVLYDGFLCYHGYWSADEVRTYIADYWDYHCGRFMKWDAYFASQGVFPEYILSEGGICKASANGTSFDPTTGWKGCGPFSRYLTDMSTFHSIVKTWNAAHGNRCHGVTLFCYGGYGWELFDWEPGDLAGMTAASVNWR